MKITIPCEFKHIEITWKKLEEKMNKTAIEFKEKRKNETLQYLYKDFDLLVNKTRIGYDPVGMAIRMGMMKALLELIEEKEKPLINAVTPS